MFIITTENAGSTFWLRGTVWAFSADRASTFGTEEAAKAALDRAKQFMTAKIYRAAKIISA